MEPPDDLPTSVFNFAPWRWRRTDQIGLVFVLAVALILGWCAYRELKIALTGNDY